MNTASTEIIEAMIAQWEGKKVFVEVPVSKETILTIAGDLKSGSYADTDNPYFNVWGRGFGVKFPGTDVRQIEPSTCANADGSNKQDTLIVRLKEKV